MIAAGCTRAPYQSARRADALTPGRGVTGGDGRWGRVLAVVVSAVSVLSSPYYISYHAKLYFDGPEEIGKDDYFAVPLSKIRPRVVVE